MKKEVFLKKLEDKLINKNVSDVSDLIYYYEVIIDGKIEKGESLESILSNYGDLDKLVNDILQENKDNDQFTFKDYIKASNNKDTKLNRINNSINKLEVSNQYNLTTKVWHRNVTIKPTTNNNIELKYKNKLLYPIEIYSNNDNIEITEQGHRVFIQSLIPMLSFLIIGIILYFIFSYFSLFKANTIIWASLGVATIIQGILSTIVGLLNKRNLELEIMLPIKKNVNNLELVLRSGNLSINEISTNNLKVRMLSGNTHLNQVISNNYDFKISSGNLTLNSLNNEADKLSVVTSSGNTKIYNLNVKHLNVKVLSGSIYLEDTNTYKSTFNVASGTIKTINFKTLKETNVSIKSGSFQGDNLELGDVNFNVLSGGAKLSNIVGNKEAYLYNTKISSGSFKINDEKLNTYNMLVVKELPKLTFNARVSSGSIKLNFKDD